MTTNRTSRSSPSGWSSRFLAEEFEKSSYLRLKPLDEAAYLVYPRETKFQRKHAEFYGRLRGEGHAKLKLSYEIVSENLDGSRKVDVREAVIEVEIPSEESGSAGIYRSWAEQQNRHFLNLLRYYPEESFFEYVLLQSKDRYGVRAPSFERPGRSEELTEQDLYYIFSGGLAVQQSVQRQTLRGSTRPQDLSEHISQVDGPSIESLDYEALLETAAENGQTPQPHPMSSLVPENQYFLQFNSMAAANEMTDLSLGWGQSLLRMFTVRSVDSHLQERYERQLCLDVNAITQLFSDQIIDQIAFTGSDFFVSEGTDLTVLLKLSRREAFEAAAQLWLASTQQQRPDLEIRKFNYRGHKVDAVYTTDRTVSSFSTHSGDYAIYSNSHVGIRKIIDTLTGAHPALSEASDYQYLTTLLPPFNDESSGYLYCSDAFLRRLVSPAFKIGEKRRLLAHSHLVMLNNASMMYRMEHGRSPETLSELEDQRFVSLSKIRCPHGGAYAFDAEGDTATSSVFNRIKHLTPLVELNVLKVSSEERKEYERYRSRYESFWRTTFDPIAVRIGAEQTVTLESCILPFANSGIYRDLQGMLDESPQTIDLSARAESAVFSTAFVPGRERVAELVREIPGVNGALESDPTLTDLSWLGDRCALHFCDDDAILEIDPTRLRPMNLFLPTSVFQQSLAVAALAAANYPIYLTLDVDDQDKAERLLERLASEIFLQSDHQSDITTALDAYQLPDYRGHQMYVASFQLYAAKIRFHISVVDHQLIAATRPGVLREVIDAHKENPDLNPITAHALLQCDFDAMEKLQGDLQLYWAEKARQASHRNIMPIYNLIKLYGVDIPGANQLADSKYGVTYFCPDGEYRYDADRDQVYSTAYGNRQQATQNLALDAESSFNRFAERIGRITTALRFSQEALFTTVEIERK